MQKQCTRCRITKPLTDFVVRTASRDGRSAACADCLKAAKRAEYRENPTLRAAQIARAVANRRDRFEAEPGYRRAFNMWGGVKRRTRIPPWVSIADFVPICRTAELLGPDFHVDHVIPLRHPLVCGLHVPENVRVMYGELHLLRQNKDLTLDDINALTA